MNLTNTKIVSLLKTDDMGKFATVASVSKGTVTLDLEGAFTELKLTDTDQTYVRGDKVYFDDTGVMTHVVKAPAVTVKSSGSHNGPAKQYVDF